jgi:hypothetical protein
MDNVILVRKLEDNQYYIGISEEILADLPQVITDNVYFLDESLESDWGYNEDGLDESYRYMCIGVDKVSSIILARYASQLFPKTPGSTIDSQKYETIAF